MKTIIYNDDYLEEKDINKTVRRAKVLLYNSNDEILLAFSHNNYFLVGGHLEEKEDYFDCIKREVLEETGILLELSDEKPYFIVEYLCKNYPSDGDNTKFIAKYFAIKTDMKFDMTKIELTDSEKDGNFELRYIHKDKVVEELTESLKICTKKNAVIDTIDAVDEFIRQN